MRTVLAALVGIVMLAGCTTTVSGTGRELSAAPSTRSSSAQPSATAFPSSPAPPSTTRPASPSRSRRVPIDNLHVGDCIDPAPTGSGSVYTMPVVSCAQAHDQEVLGSRLPSSPAPPPTRPAPPSRPRRVPIDNLHVGDCIDPAPTGSGSVYTMPVVSCALAHDQEVFVSRNLSPAAWPGDAALAARTEKLCTTEFAQFIGIAIDESLLDFDYYVPDKESWQGGDHLVLCLAYDPEGKTVGTLHAARR